MAYAPTFLILLLLLLFWSYASLYPIISPVSIPSFLLSLSIESVQWSSLAASSSLLSPPMDLIYHSHSITNVFTQSLLHIPRPWAFLVVSSSTRHLLWMKMVVSQSIFFHIGTDNFFFLSSLISCTSTSNCNFAWLMMMVNAFSLLLMIFLPPI